jgi:hypothetical protein
MEINDITEAKIKTKMKGTHEYARMTLHRAHSG